jgi:hypothetical protein
VKSSTGDRHLFAGHCFSLGIVMYEMQPVKCHFPEVSMYNSDSFGTRWNRGENILSTSTVRELKSRLGLYLAAAAYNWCGCGIWQPAQFNSHKQRSKCVSNSPWIFGAPQPEFSDLIRRRESFGRATKSEEKPHEPRRGWLKNRNPSGDFTKAPRCRAKTRRGSECQCPAMINARWRLHGGVSTGPKTESVWLSV